MRGRAAKVFFVAGDLSGDAHAARVARAIKEKDPRTEILAVGGPALEKTADRFLLNLVEQSVVGFLEPLKKVPWFFRVLKETIRPILAKEKPDVVVPVDFFGFNRHVAQAGKEAAARVLYFISPQVWASRPGRVAALKKHVDRMLVIFPFEKEVYEKSGVPVTFVGHPLLDHLPEVPIDAAGHVEPLIGLLPGSRAGEVRRHLPLFLETADLLSRRSPGLRFVLFAARSLSNDFYDSLLGRDRQRPYLLEIVRDENYEWRRGVDVALTVSGTATLENALLGLPMAVVYKMSWPTYWLARALIRVDRISMPNLLAKKDLVPEFIQREATPARLAAFVKQMMDRPAERRAMRRELLSLKALLGGAGAASRAADEILEAAAAVPAAVTV